MLWFGVHFSRLGLEIFERRQPAEPARATVLIDDNRVLLMNGQANTIGISVGATLATAHSIASDLKHFNRDLVEEQNRLSYLAEAAYRYTSHVSICGPNCLLMDMHASLELFGGVTALTSKLGMLFRHVRHVADIAAAHTPAAALALARAGRSSELDDYPGAESIVANSLDALADVPLECAEFETKDIERFANMGVFKLGQLMGLPREELGARFGRGLQDYLARLNGDAPDPRLSITPRETFSSSVHLIEPVPDKHTLLFPMRRLVIELATWLNARQLGVKRLIWRFRPLRGQHSEIEVRFASPRLDAKGILDVSRLKLEGADVVEEVMSITLVAADVMAWSTEVFDLFGAQARAGIRAKPMDLIDQLEARLGNKALQGLKLVDDHRPEFAWAPQAPGTKQRPVNGMKEANGKNDVARPLWLFEPPHPVDVEHFQLLSGPERIEAGWWQDTVARDYFIAVHEDGAQCWLYVCRGRKACREVSDRLKLTPVSGRRNWFLHGYFA